LTRPTFLFAPSGALRAPWRITIFIVVTVVALIASSAFLGTVVTRASAAASAPGAGDSVLACVALLVSTFVCVRYVDRRGWDAVWLGRKAARPRLWGEGFVVGALAIGLPCLALVAAGQMRFSAAPEASWWAAAARVSWVLLPAALLEELLTRGYLFAVLRESVGWRPALALTSVVFGLFHVPNNGATVETITLVTLAGVLLGAIVLATNSLYAAWMAHFGWNWAMAVPLHSPVSGFPLATPDYQLVDAGPRWLTGGAWGPEGGLAAAAGMMAALIYLYTRQRRREES
jgi:membrane protease YdiL (CAAX protease family)